MKNNHKGIMKRRGERLKKPPRLGYYLIVTEGKETEKNYFDGLRDSLPENIRNNIVIKTISTDTKSLVRKVEELRAKTPCFPKTWVIFDRDQNYTFDQLIGDVESHSASAGWSNPCFEIWLNAYFGEMPNYQTSTECCEGFSKTFKTKTGKEYEKNIKDIYKRLIQFGDEDKAIRIADSKLKEAMVKANAPSKMCPATTVHELIKEIRGKQNQ